MQTYTHVLIGAALGAALHPGDLVAQAACGVGALLPDVVQVPRYLLDRARGRRPLETVPPEILRLKFVFHSIPVWGALLGGSLLLGWTPLVAFCTGGLSHPLVDAVTHREPKYWTNDAGFLWPLSVRLARYTGLWEYRIDHGVLRPKPLEATVGCSCLAFWAWVHLGACV